jgi:hypothetical protein
LYFPGFILEKLGEGKRVCGIYSTCGKVKKKTYIFRTPREKYEWRCMSR